MISCCTHTGAVTCSLSAFPSGLTRDEVRLSFTDAGGWAAAATTQDAAIVISAAYTEASKLAQQLQASQEAACCLVLSPAAFHSLPGAYDGPQPRIHGQLVHRHLCIHDPAILQVLQIRQSDRFFVHSLLAIGTHHQISNMARLVSRSWIWHLGQLLQPHVRRQHRPPRGIHVKDAKIVVSAQSSALKQLADSMPCILTGLLMETDASELGLIAGGYEWRSRHAQLSFLQLLRLVA